MKHLMDCISGSQRDAWFQLRNRNKRQIVYSWRRRVEVELKLPTSKPRRMMTLPPPPFPNWSQMEPVLFEIEPK